MPKDWDKSWIVNVHKGKGDALECGSYRGIKLLEHVMKVLERVIESRVRNIVKIDEMQFGFMSGTCLSAVHTSFPGKAGLNPGAFKSGCVLYS